MSRGYTRDEKIKNTEIRTRKSCTGRFINSTTSYIPFAEGKMGQDHQNAESNNVNKWNKEFNTPALSEGKMVY